MVAGKDSPQQGAHVVHIAQSVAGGIASYLEEIADYQNERFGAGNVAFVVPAGSERFARLDPDQIIGFGSASRRATSLADFASTARSAIDRLKPSIVHLHSSFAGAIVRGLLVGRKQRPRIVYCPHGWAFSMDGSPVKRALYAWVERRLAAMTDLIYVNSQFEFDLGARFGIPLERMQVIPNGIAWSPAPSKDVRDGPIRIAFIGRHDRQKGLDILLDAIPALPPGIEFHIVGDSVVSAAGRTASAQGANVSFHGWLSRSETLEMLRSVDAVVMPSRWEAFGLVAIEAMRAAVPVIASNRGALPEIVRDGETGYVFDLDDPRSLGAILAGLDKAELRRLGLAARARWEKLYVADRMNERISDAYRRVLSQQGPEAGNGGQSSLPEASTRQSEPA